MFEKFLIVIKTALDSFMDEKYQTFITSFRPLAISILTIYILTGAIKIFTGNAEKPKEMMWTALTASIITGIVFSYDMYKDWLLEPIIGLSFKLQGYFLTNSSTPPDLVFGIIDQNFSNLFYKLSLITEGVGWYEGALIKIVGFLIAAVYGALYIIFSVMIIFSLFAMYIFFIIGGIPLFLAIMPSTRFVFWAWLRGVANYALIPVFASIVMAIFLSSLSIAIHELKITNGDVWNITVATMFFIGFVAIFFLFKSSEFAAALTGGQPSTVSGFMGSMVSLGAMSTIPAARALAPKIATAGRYGAKYGGQALGAAGRGIADGASRVADGASRAYSALKGIFNKKGD
jgi:hypothetical protein